MASSRLRSFVVLLSVSWAILAVWAAALDTLPLVLGAGFPFLLGVVWALVSSRRDGWIVWPAVVTLGAWQVLLLALLFILVLPLMGAAMGAHTGLAGGVGLAPAVPLLGVGLLITWATAGWLVRSAPESVPSARATGVSLFASSGIVVLVGGIVVFVSRREAAALQATLDEGVAEATAANTLIADVRTGARDAADLRALSQQQGGYSRLERVATDESVAAGIRAASVAQLLAIDKNFERRETYPLAAELIRDDDAAVRLAIVDGMPASPWSTQSLPLLGGVLTDPDPRVRMRASIKLVSINGARHEYWEAAYKELQILLQTLPGNPSIRDDDVRCGVYQLSTVATDIVPLLELILRDPALTPVQRRIITRWRDFIRDPSPSKVAPADLYQDCL